MAISEKFKNRINELVEENTDIKVTQLAVEMKLDYRTLSYAIKYGIVPSTRKLITIADYFNVSIGYLLGQSNQEYFLKSEERSDFKNRFKLLCKDRNLTFYKVSIDCHFDKSYISRWLNKNYLPSLEFLEILSEYFNVSIDYLLGRADD